MKNFNITKITIIVLIISIIIPINFVYSQESKTIQVEVKYTNGDLADFYGMHLVVYQDYNNIPILEKEMENNPDSILLQNGHKYKIEVYANGMYGDIGYVDLKNNQEKININIPLSGGLQFNIFYKDGQMPINGATVSIKSHDGTQWKLGKTNDNGDTLRYWIQSTTKDTDYYIADVYLGEIYLTTLKPIKLVPGLTKDQKIIVPIPAIVEDLITISIYKTEFEKIAKQKDDFLILLKDNVGNIVKKSPVNNRGEAYFSSIPSGEYLLVVLKNGTPDVSWSDKKITILGKENMFKIIQTNESTTIPGTTKNTHTEDNESISSCNCVAFRFDDVQDYWLNDVQIAYVNTFVEKNIPLTVGIRESSFGNDQKITNVIKEAVNKKKLEIANQETLDKFPKTATTGEYSIEQNRFIGISNNNTYSKVEELLKKDGFAVIISHPQEFSMIQNGTYSNQVNKKQFEELESLIKKLESGGIRIVSIDKINSDSTVIIIPQWIKNNAKWWADGSIDDDSFIQGIQFLIKEKIMNIPATQNSATGSNEIPIWIKNNAKWWADNKITDSDFVKGIEYLVNYNIITY